MRTEPTPQPSTITCKDCSLALVRKTHYLGYLVVWVHASTGRITCPQVENAQQTQRARPAAALAAPVEQETDHA